MGFARYGLFPFTGFSPVAGFSRRGLFPLRAFLLQAFPRCRIFL